jgi:hypothetical protein
VTTPKKAVSTARFHLERAEQALTEHIARARKSGSPVHHEEYAVLAEIRTARIVTERREADLCRQAGLHVGVTA